MIMCYIGILICGYSVETNHQPLFPEGMEIYFQNLKPNFSFALFKTDKTVVTET
jgi:hypothetical protein